MLSLLDLSYFAVMLSGAGLMIEAVHGERVRIRIKAATGHRSR